MGRGIAVGGKVKWEREEEGLELGKYEKVFKCEDKKQVEKEEE